jgi:hypothetical protein
MKFKNKKGQISSTLTWFVAFLIIFFIMMIFIVAVTVLAIKDIGISDIFDDKQAKKGYLKLEDKGDLINNFVCFLNSPLEIKDENMEIKDFIADNSKEIFSVPAKNNIDGQVVNFLVVKNDPDRKYENFLAFYEFSANQLDEIYPEKCYVLCVYNEDNGIKRTKDLFYPVKIIGEKCGDNNKEDPFYRPLERYNCENNLYIFSALEEYPFGRTYVGDELLIPKKDEKIKIKLFVGEILPER